MRRSLVLLATCALLAPLRDAGATDVRRLRPGVLLYAVPRLRDPNFAESVVLLVQHGPQGAMGLIVNRPSDALAEDALPELEGLRGQPIYRGGPVQAEVILALVRTAQPSAKAIRVLEDVHMTGSQVDLEAAAKRGRAYERVRLYSGYAGWAAGQLEDEVRRGDWVVVRADVATIFSTAPGSLWQKVYELTERKEARA
jgi:putative transcriptional regulator